MTVSAEQRRVRFAPSPTGYLHIGGARTVLFNWLLAQKTGGKFILRIEDTDRSRHVEDSVGKILADLRWLGLNWDEGPEAGGDVGPYFQSKRLDIYQKFTDRLLESGQAYYAMESAEELASAREKSRAEKRDFKYPRPSPLPTIDEGRAARESGQAVPVRFKMPDEDIVIQDDVLGEVRLSASDVEDFIIQKHDGWPTYHFACVVDDELMGITDVLRGQEHLSNTPKHVALQNALGFRTPRYAHLPIIFNSDGSKMSKRDKEKAIAKGLAPPEIDVHDFRVAGYAPEALLNFISLLGWSPGGDREQLSIEETVDLFTVDRIGTANARFDRDKLIAFNTDWVAKIPSDRLVTLLRDFSQVNDLSMAAADDATLARLLECCKGFRTFRDVQSKTGFLFVDDADIAFDPKAVKKVLAKNDGAGFAMLEHLRRNFKKLDPWDEAGIEQLIASLCAEHDVKMGAIAQPIRVAVTGSTISPPIHDTLILLGRERTLRRIDRAIEHGAAEAA